MIESSSLNEIEIRERMHLLEAIFSFTPDGLVSFNEQKKIARVNPAFIVLTNTEQEIWEGLNEEDFRAKLLELCHLEEKTDNSPWSTILHFLTADNAEGRVFAVCKIVPPTGGSFMHFHDITQSYSQNKRLNKEFWAHTAHDLRTPIASVQGFSELLLNNTFDASVQKEILGIIREESIKVIGLINKLVSSAS
ncbi:MAG: histidine kinase dimerization/phospho-acceptor domain-containing protein [Pseudomonadota bacterium]